MKKPTLVIADTSFYVYQVHRHTLVYGMDQKGYQIVQPGEYVVVMEEAKPGSAVLMSIAVMDEEMYQRHFHGKEVSK